MDDLPARTFGIGGYAEFRTGRVHIINSMVVDIRGITRRYHVRVLRSGSVVVTAEISSGDLDAARLFTIALAHGFAIAFLA